MDIGIITLFPELFSAVMQYGVTGRTVQNEQLNIHFFNPRDYTTDNRRTVDDRPYGGGPGMVMCAPPLVSAISAARKHLTAPVHTIYLSPQGTPLTQERLTQYASHTRLLLVAGRYEGIDERVIENEINEEISIGDYVLSGGELPAMVFIDALARLLPGALGNDLSARQDSFTNNQLDYPQYTRPAEYHGHKVPPVLLSGDHRAIENWRKKNAEQRTHTKRPDLSPIT